MGFFNKYKKEVPTPSTPKITPEQKEFIGDNQFISGGNLFQMNEQAKAIEEKEKLEWNGEPIDDQDTVVLDNQIANTTKHTTPYKYYQYIQLCNYFINLYKYECEDVELLEQIKKMQMIAFFSGRAGLFRLPIKNKWVAVSIESTKTNDYDELEEVTINTKYIFDENVERDGTYTPDKKYNRVLQNEDLNDLVIYKMRNNGASCWIWAREYINVQNQILNQISVCSLVNNKLIAFVMDSKNDNKKSLLSFLRPNRFWIYTRQSNKMNDSIKILKDIIDTDITVKYLDIYRQTMDVYSDYLGIRNNTEYKKERNTVDEVNAEQGWFDAIEYEFYFNFYLFVEKFNKKSNVKIKLDDFGRSNEQDDVNTNNNERELQESMNEG